MTIDRNEITTGLWLQYTWHRHEGPNPVTWQSADAWDAAKREEASAGQSLMDEVRQVAPSLQETANALNERFGVTRLVAEQRASRPHVPCSAWPGWYEPRDVIAVAMGAREPLRLNNIWWHDRGHYPLEKVDSVADLARLRVPDWSHVECVQRMLDSRDRWHSERPTEPKSGFGLVWGDLAIPGRGAVRAICYPSFVDLGLYLMGATRFMTMLGGEPDLADAFMALCFDLSTSYTEFLLSLHPEPFTGLCGFGGDATFFLSPGLYERYSAAWDARLFDYVRAGHNLPSDAPCNLHSCGSSAHLYEHWGRHPYRSNITAMQTRLIPAAVRRLRAALPDTQLELTLHPPEFDLASAEPEAIRAVLHKSADDAGSRDVHFGFIAATHRPDDLPRLAHNVEVVLQTMEDLRSSTNPIGS